MTPATIRSQIVLEKTAWVRSMLDEIAGLPCASVAEFTSDRRTAAAAESYLRRALEALLDLCRHVVTKGFGDGVLEYKQVAGRLASHGVLSADTAALLVRMAGYRNRMVHFYDEVAADELFRICTEERRDLELVVDEILGWLRRHPDLLDREL
jgi:uncharacterized protein YutE (UPF0331/DUF86 family)